MTDTPQDDSVTKLTDEAKEEADAEAMFAEVVAEREPPQRAADDDDTSTTQGKAAAEANTAGEGSDATSQGQSGGSEDAAAAAAASGDGDIWAGADPKLKAAFDEKAAEATRATQQFRSREGRERALQGRIAELERSGGGEEGQPRKPLKELLAAENITALKEEYPDFAPLLEALAEQAERVDGVSQAVGEAHSTAVAAATAPQEQALNAAVPNWLELAQHEGFTAWVEDQTKKVRDTVADNWNAITDAKGAAEVFKAFEEHIAPPAGGGAGGAPSRRDRQAAGAKTTAITAPTAAGGESDDPAVIFAEAAAKSDRSRGIRG